MEEVKSNNRLSFHSSFIGEYEGYLYTIVKVGGKFLPYYFLAFTFEHPLEKSILKDVNHELHTISQLSTFQYLNDVLLITLRSTVIKNDVINGNELSLTLQECISFFKQHQMIQSKRCAICKTDKREPLVSKAWNNAAVFIHPTCADTHANEVLKEYNLESVMIGRLPFSVMLTFIFSLIGALPLIITLLSSGKLFLVFYTIIPLFSFLGYKLGKAPKRKYMIFIVIITSVLVTLGVEIYIWYLYAVANNTTLSILLSYSSGFMLVFSEIFIALLFVSIGIFLSWRFIFKTSDKNLQTVTRLTDRE
ncbi:MAG: hypothetical protein PHP54_06290 [Clostridia bacterium]|jgi:hypothetical protein|nr:hypothetical protein [Clostridia bacterium]